LTGLCNRGIIDKERSLTFTAVAVLETVLDFGTDLNSVVNLNNSTSGLILHLRNRKLVWPSNVIVLSHDVTMIRRHAGIARLIARRSSIDFISIWYIHNPFRTYTQPYNVCEKTRVSFAF